MQTIPTMPTIFISHRHTDSQIANVINKHLRRWGFPPNSIYQSSAATGRGPRIGEPLAQNLLDALSRANAVLLVYTFAKDDWSYCMWECGVATDPQSPNTRIIVFQTTDDIPSVLVCSSSVEICRWLDTCPRYDQQPLQYTGELPALTNPIDTWSTSLISR